ncbi:hypothetical protein [Rhodohalobacter barkolensis]|jgi:hypothetical protein|nr:hypothetical protein [Rhodohalobacter barkolensis]
MKTEKSIQHSKTEKNVSLFKQIDLKIELWVQHLVEQIEYAKSN